ncbi:hypothetical protein BpHYR1_044326 [Brachionus plicatilis]|uniref:Uncharacterized protein n=1 Tax=Brachionus plicatilis TaxID=10195 RepID=A0A3M7T666_BRAPC|nr:hypothetical protein BpHYR1_044326 [Brachionus plicatilis]
MSHIRLCTQSFHDPDLALCRIHSLDHKLILISKDKLFELKCLIEFIITFYEIVTLKGFTSVFTFFSLKICKNPQMNHNGMIHMTDCLLLLVKLPLEGDRCLIF